jgi:hypothetical protein
MDNDYEDRYRDSVSIYATLAESIPEPVKSGTLAKSVPEPVKSQTESNRVASYASATKDVYNDYDDRYRDSVSNYTALAESIPEPVKSEIEINLGIEAEIRMSLASHASATKDLWVLAEKSHSSASEDLSPLPEDRDEILDVPR